MSDELTMYERAAAVAGALNDADREVFAALLDDLTRPTVMDYRRIRRAVSVRRWLRDAGWVKR